MTNMEDSELRQQIADLDIEFLHGVPVKLPSNIVDILLHLIHQRLEWVERKARLDELSQINFHGQGNEKQTLAAIYTHFLIRNKELWGDPRLTPPPGGAGKG